MNYCVGIDLGGTNIVAGVVNKDGTILEKASCKTNLPREAADIAADMAKVTREAVKNAGLTMEDKVAFPYGEDVKEGAATREVDSLFYDSYYVG